MQQLQPNRSANSLNSTMTMSITIALQLYNIGVVAI